MKIKVLIALVGIVMSIALTQKQVKKTQVFEENICPMQIAMDAVILAK